LVGNIIIHKEYNSAIPTEVVIYEDRVETTNPNRIRFKGPLDLETFDAEPKNPNIRAFFNVLTWADEIGSGVKNMNKFVVAYTGGAHPMFIEDEPFLSVIPMITYQVGDMYRIYRSLAQLKDEELGEERLKQLMSYPLDLSLKGLSDWDEVAFHLVRSWDEKSREFDDFRFLINNNISLEDLKKVGTWEEKSEELLKKRGRILLSTLLLTILPISLEELATLQGYKSKERYRDDYVKPLKNNGFIEYTLEQANDPNQQYQITQRGRNFLTGS